MPKTETLSTKIEAYYMFLKNYDQAAIATACGVSSRTVRNWIKDDAWSEDARCLEGLVRGVVLMESVLDFVKYLKDVDQAESKATGGSLQKNAITTESIRKGRA